MAYHEDIFLVVAGNTGNVSVNKIQFVIKLCGRILIDTIFDRDFNFNFAFNNFIQ